MPDINTKIQRVLAFDFGTQHIGVAVGQSLTQSGQTLPSLRARNGIAQWTEIERIVATWQVDIILVGLPLHMDGSENELCRRARKFANRLHNHLRIAIELVDERLSSEAAQDLELSGDIHSKAALLIMQTWFSKNTAN